MNNLLLEIKNLKKKFQHSNNYITVLENLNLEIKNTDIISIIGPSGVGKTTLLNIIGFLDSFDEGEYFFDKKDQLQVALLKP